MKKTVFVMFFMLMACVLAHAQQSIDIHLNDLSILSTPLASLDKITMHGDTLYVTSTDGSANHTIHMSDIDYIDFSGDYIETAVKPIDAKTGFYISNNVLVLECDVEGAKSIFSVDGKLMATFTEAETMLNISSLPAGVYVLVMGKQTLKFSKP